MPINQLISDLQEFSTALRETAEVLENQVNCENIDFEKVNITFDELASVYVNLQTALKNSLYTPPKAT